MIRINKFLSQCGVASRRNADLLLVQGRVAINGQVVGTPGLMVNEETDQVLLDGQVIHPVDQKEYIVLNKPAGYLTSLSDPHHRKTVVTLLGGVGRRVYPVGRLDLDTEGTLLLTNDGELAHRLTHPKYGVTRVYNARVTGAVDDQKLALFAKGIRLPDGNIGKADAVRLESGDRFTDLKLELKEGRKREVRHLCRAVGHPVLRLVRISFAGITCDDLGLGQWRRLNSQEIGRLRELVSLDQ